MGESAGFFRGRLVPWLLLAIVLLPVAARAQATDDPPLSPPATEQDIARVVDLLRQASVRLDIHQGRFDAQVTLSSGLAWIDTVKVFAVGEHGDNEPVLEVEGWATTCDGPINAGSMARVVPVVDGIETPDKVESRLRPDVKAWAESSGYCRQFGGGWTPENTGVGIRIPLRVLTRGTEAAWHYVWFRVYDLYNRAIDSAPVPFHLPAPPPLVRR